jgi:hypothetical protein
MAITRYVEEGYVEAGYVEVIVEPNAATFTIQASVSCDALEFLADERYVEEGYVEAGYVEVTKFLEPLTLNTTLEISADLTEVTAIEASASISSAFSLSSTIGTLESAGASFSIAFSQTADIDKIPSGGANLSSAFSTNIDIEKILDADATLNSAVDVTADGARTVEASANFGGLFSPNIIVGVLKVIDATLDASADLSATISKFTGNEATLSNIVNLSLQGAKTADYNASLSSAFSQTSTANFTTSANANLSVTSNLTEQSGFLIEPTASNASGSSVINITISSHLFTSKWPANGRPVTWQKRYGATNTTSTNIDFSSSEKKYGTHSLQFKTTGYNVLSSGLEITNNRIESNQDFVFEIWAKQEGDNTSADDEILIALTNTATSASVPSDYNNPGSFPWFYIGADGDYIAAKFRNFGTGNYIEVRGDSPTDLNNSVWNSNWQHIVFRRYNGNTVELRVNNVSIDTVSYSGAIGGSTSSATGIGQLFLTNNIQVPSNSDMFYDGLHFQIGTSTYTGYSSNPAGSGTEYTRVLNNFDNNFDDDLGLTLEASASITSQASTSAQIGGVFLSTATANSEATVTANVEALLGADSTLTTQATVTATATRIQQGASSTSSAVTVSVDAVKTTDVNSTQSSEFTTQIDGGAIRNAIGDFDSIATQLTAASKIGDFFINADSQFATTATAVKTTDIDDVLSSSFALTASETTLFKAFDSSVSSAFTTSVTATKTTDVDSTQTSAFAQTASGDRIRFGVSSVTANANLVVETAPLRNAEADLSSSFVQPNTTVLRIKQLEASVDSVLTVSANVIKAVSASGTASSAFTQSTDVNRTRDVDADFDSVATQLTAVAKIGDFLIDADVQASLTATARKTTGNVIAMDTQFVITAIPGAIRQGASTQTSAFAVEAEGTSNITGEGELDSAVTVSADAIKTVEGSASFGGAGGFVVAAVATRNNEIIAGISSTVTADVKRIRTADATLLTAITTQITAGKRVEVASLINSSVTISATVRVVNIDDIVYTIPAETREYSIVAETSEYTVVAETREYTVT